MDETTFDEAADRELKALVRDLDTLDGIEAELEMGVLTVSFEAGPSFVLNSHRAARQIWMAADRTAWHFDPDANGTTWTSTKTPHDTLRPALSAALSKRLGRSVTLP
jgi:CyaY protein